MEVVTTWGEVSSRKREPLSQLARLSRNASLYLVGFFIIIQVILSGFAPLLALYGVGALIAYLIGGTGRRWAPLAHPIWAVALFEFVGDEMIFDLLHPAENQVLFVFSAALAGGLSVAFIGGIAATIQNYLHPPAERKDFRWIRTVLLTMVGIFLGATAVTSILENNVDLTAGVSPETLKDLPAITAELTKFREKELRVKAGELVTLRLDNFDVGIHSFDIDEFNVHAPMPIGQSGLAMFTPTTPGTYRFYCAIPAHTELGMVGTLIVEP